MIVTTALRWWQRVRHGFRPEPRISMMNGQVTVAIRDDRDESFRLFGVVRDAIVADARERGMLPPRPSLRDLYEESFGESAAHAVGCFLYWGARKIADGIDREQLLASQLAEAKQRVEEQLVDEIRNGPPRRQWLVDSNGNVLPKFAAGGIVPGGLTIRFGDGWPVTVMPLLQKDQLRVVGNGPDPRGDTTVTINLSDDWENTPVYVARAVADAIGKQQTRIVRP